MKFGDKNLPDTAAATGTHGVTASIPVVELPDNTDTRRIGCPSGKEGAVNVTNTPLVGAENAVGVVVIAFGKKV